MSRWGFSGTEFVDGFTILKLIYGNSWPWAALLLAILSGCATIRKFNPIEAHTLEARHLTQQAEAAIHRSEWAEAESKLVRAIEKCPEDTRARSVLANVLWERGAKEAAVEQKTRSVEMAGGHDATELTELGQMEFSTGDLEQALVHASAAIRQDSSHADAWTLRGFVLRAMDRPDDALGAFFRSLSIRPDDPRTRLEIAGIYRETGEPRQALAILGAAPHEADSPCPYYPDVCYLRGLLLRDLERPDDAVAAFTLARDNGCTANDLVLRLADAQFAAEEFVAS